MNSLRAHSSPSLSWYLVRECALYFGVTLFAFTGVLLTIRMLRFASLVINRGVDFSQIATVFISLIPTFLEIAIPLAALLGVMLAIARLSGDSEIVVMRAAGVSIYQLIAPVFLFGLLCGGCSLFISLYLRPYGFKVLQDTLFEIARTKSTASLTAGIFNPLGDMTVYADEIDSRTGRLHRVLIDDRRSAEARKVVLAHEGQIRSNPVHRTIELFLRDGEMHETSSTGSYGVTRFRENSVSMSDQELGGEDAVQKGQSPRELYMPELRTQIARHRLALQRLYRGDTRDDLELDMNAVGARPSTGVTIPIPGSNRSEITRAQGPEDDPLLAMKAPAVKRKYVRLKLERALRFAMPCAAAVLALIALPLGIQPPRSQKTWGPGLSAVLGMSVFVLYYATLSLGSTLVDRGALNPDLCAWLPNILALGIACYSIERMGSERWHSIAHGLESILQSGAHLVRRVRPSTRESSV